MTNKPSIIKYVLKGHETVVSNNTKTPRRDAAKALRELQNNWRRPVLIGGVV